MNFKEKTLLHRLTARYRHNKFFSSALKFTGKQLDNKKWIFIIGCYNSGTTLLNEILASHPEISGLPDEGVMLTSELVKPEDFGWRRMWWKCEVEMENSPINLNKKSETIKKHWSHFYKDKNLLVEKSISNVCRIPFLNENFKDAYFIHIVRNGYAASEGIRRKAEIMPGNQFYGSKHYPMDICIRQWTKTLDNIEEQKNNMPNYLEISYEALTEDTQVTFNKITKFIDVPKFQEDFLSKSFAIHGKQSEIKNMNENSFKKLSREDISTINSIAENHLINKGYSLL